MDIRALDITPLSHGEQMSERAFQASYRAMPRFRQWMQTSLDAHLLETYESEDAHYAAPGATNPRYENLEVSPSRLPRASGHIRRAAISRWAMALFPQSRLDRMLAIKLGRR